MILISVRNLKLCALGLFLGFVVELEQTLTVDGVYKLLFTINGEFPGPPIIVYEGQTVGSLFLFLSFSLSPFFFTLAVRKRKREREIEIKRERDERL